MTPLGPGITCPVCPHCPVSVPAEAPNSLLSRPSGWQTNSEQQPGPATRVVGL